MMSIFQKGACTQVPLSSHIVSAACIIIQIENRYLIVERSYLIKSSMIQRFRITSILIELDCSNFSSRDYKGERLHL